MWFPNLFASPKPRPTRAPDRQARPDDARRRSAAIRLWLDALDDRTLPSFLGPVSYAAGSYPYAVVAGDFTNDAVPDLAVANYYGGTVSVLAGNADGTFQTAVASAAGSYPSALVAGYLNADARLDLVTISSGGLSVLLGNGDGTFQAPSTVGLGSTAASVAVGDFNGDGKMDLAGTSNEYIVDGYTYGYWGSYPYGHYESRANVLLGNGDGSFAGPLTTDLGVGYHTGAAAADLNSDGRDDFVTTDSSSLVDVLLANPGGGLQAPAARGTGLYPASVVVGDFNGDGVGDLMTRNNGGVSVLLGNGGGGVGDGTFQSAVTTNLGFYPYSTAVGDFNRDGKMDLGATTSRFVVDGYYVGYYGGSYPYGHDEAEAHVLLGHGNGHFSDVDTTDLGPDSTSGIAGGDFNGDRYPDLAVATPNTNGVSVLLNDASWPPLPPPSASINDVTVTEGNAGSTNATFTVTLEFAAEQDVTIHYATAGGIATAGSDYTAVSGDVIIHTGDTTAAVTVPVLGDRVGESNETFSVTISATGAAVADGQASGTIVDDEPRISVNDAPVVTEGNAGSTNATFTVSLSGVYDQDVTVHYATANGSATAGSDYTGVTDAVVTVPRGQTSATFRVAVLGDRTAEPNEGFTVNLSGATNSLITDGSGAGTILDDEPRITIGDVSKKEGTQTGKNGSTTAFVFTISLSGVYDQDVTVHYATANGSATAGSDYTGVTVATVTIRAGQLSATITIVVTADKTKESDEWFAVNLAGPSSNAMISDSQAFGWILDDDAHGNGKP